VIGQSARLNELDPVRHDEHPLCMTAGDRDQPAGEGLRRPNVLHILEKRDPSILDNVGCGFVVQALRPGDVPDQVRQPLDNLAQYWTVAGAGAA
jgi:hypothetical protein